MNLKATIKAEVAKHVQAAVAEALAEAFESNSSASSAHDAPKASAKANGKASNATVQDLVDCVRRAARYGRTNKTLSKAERKLFRSVVKGAKTEFTVVAGKNDVFSRNRL